MKPNIAYPSCTALVASLVLLAPALASADVFTISQVTTIHSTGAATLAAGTNDLGDIVGSVSGDAGLSAWIYIRGESSLFQVPSADETTARSISNKRRVVGAFVQDGTHGYAYQGGTLVKLDAPGWEVTYASGINDKGEIVGQVLGPVAEGSFLFKNGIFTYLVIPGSLADSAQGINNFSQIVGPYLSADGVIRGYVYKNGVTTSIEFPEASYTIPTGINDLGQIVGHYGLEPGVSHGFVYWKGVFSTVDVPGSDSTLIMGVNDHGMIVGTYNTPEGADGFRAMLRRTTGKGRPR